MHRYLIPALLLAGVAAAQDPITLEPGIWVDETEWGEPSAACDAATADRLRDLYTDRDLRPPPQRRAARTLGWDREAGDRCGGGSCVRAADANTQVITTDPEAGEPQSMMITRRIEGPDLMTSEIILVPDVDSPECEIAGTGSLRRVADVPGPERYALSVDPGAEPIVPRSGTWELAEEDWSVSDGCTEDWQAGPAPQLGRQVEVDWSATEGPAGSGRLFTLDRAVAWERLGPNEWGADASIISPYVGVRTVQILSATEIRTAQRLDDMSYAAPMLGGDAALLEECMLADSAIWRFVPPG